MSERERWIVYPLIFFALGAALRDKFFQQVHTKELHCERVVADEIICGDVEVVDPDHPGRALAGLGSRTFPAPDGKGRTIRSGVLALNNQQFGSVTGNPPPEARRGVPPQARPTANSPKPSPPPPSSRPAADSTPHVLVPSE